MTWDRKDFVKILSRLFCLKGTFALLIPNRHFPPPDPPAKRQWGQPPPWPTTSGATGYARFGEDAKMEKCEKLLFFQILQAVAPLLGTSFAQ